MPFSLFCPAYLTLLRALPKAHLHSKPGLFPSSKSLQRSDWATNVPRALWPACESPRWLLTQCRLLFLFSVLHMSSTQLDVSSLRTRPPYLPPPWAGQKASTKTCYRGAEYIRCIHLSHKYTFNAENGSGRLGLYFFF